VVGDKGGLPFSSSGRTSSTAALPLDDLVVNCIRERVAELQGYESPNNVETPQITSYQKGQEYRYHYDYFSDSRSVNRTWNRITTIFGILDANCENCTTEFPNISIDWSNEDMRWCRFVDCAAQSLKVLPVPGSALFWRNLLSNGSGDPRTLHAGSPLSSGFKVGLNIWTRQHIT